MIDTLSVSSQKFLANFDKFRIGEIRLLFF